jgi:hypothetical protein
VSARLDEIEARVGSSVATTDSVVATLDDLQTSVGELSVRRQAEEDAAARLQALSATVDDLLDRPRDDALLAGRIEELERRLEIVTEAGSASDTPEPGQWAKEAASLGVRIDALAAIVSEARERPVRESAGPGEPGGDVDLELERLRMAIERMSMHLGEQERALAEAMRSRDVTGRLDALEARIDDVEEAPATSGASGPVAAAGGKEARALARRLDAAEAQLEEERNRMFTKMERIASAIAWRLERLEAMTQQTSGDD